MRPLHLLHITIVSIFLVSCNIKPAYNAGLASEIFITHISSVEGIKLRKSLIDIIGNANEQAKYHLNASISYSTSHLVINKKSDVTEQCVEANVAFSVVDRQKKVTIIDEKFVLRGSYHEASSPYITYKSEEVKKLDLATKAAEEIWKRLSLMSELIH